MMTPRRLYQDTIRQEMAAMGMVGRHDPAVVEAWMRLERDTLDSLDRARLRREVVLAVACADCTRPADNVELAESYGLEVTHG